MVSRFLDFNSTSSIDGRFMQSEHWTSSDDWPREWIDVAFKTYPRFPAVALPDVPWNPRLNLSQAFSDRRSERATTAPLDHARLSVLLKEALRVWHTPENPGARRAYPSAGARFPVEAYLVWRGDPDLKAGLYHYRPLDHHLEELTDRPMEEDLLAVFGHEWISRAQAVVLLTAEFSRSAVKYGERAYRFALLEAGHLAQNLLLVAADLAVAATPVGGFADDRLNRLLDIGRTDERAIYSVVVP
ncbi:SagB/ThcOx family dehydrogenase [Streptomyces sp. NBC_01288]|uniref:SagB/ThcOx family dehydrogenase n=1 Tax=Streptomyces sp. NBC_01288 TaxID=2903814 RepID=UPI002E15DB7E|nr:SagB/ThcOx family dehydrogenase [Streptomyces sp. NBC_01288]